MIQIVSSTGNSFSLNKASGPLPYRLTNDYLFRALLQENNMVLKGLICSLMHISPKQIYSAFIENPIELGDSMTEKTFFLDVKVLMNDSTVINLEMQVLNIGNWPERSLSYLCRSFDQLYKGQDYAEAKPVVHIGILDFTLFPEHPEFYATYKLMNVKKHTIYSDKFRLSVLDLKHINLATMQDKRYQIHCWAKFFKAATWEEIKMLTAKNEFISEAAETLYKLTAEEKIRRQCEEREEYYRIQRTVARDQQRALEELENTRSRLDATSSQLADKESKLAVTESKLADANFKLADANSQLADAKEQIAALKARLAAIENSQEQ